MQGRIGAGNLQPAEGAWHATWGGFGAEHISGHIGSHPIVFWKVHNARLIARGHFLLHDHMRPDLKCFSVFNVSFQSLASGRIVIWHILVGWALVSYNTGRRFA